MNKIPQRFFDPTVALLIGIAAVTLRVIGKLGVGLPAHSPLLTGDGFHNIGDLGYVIAALMIMLIMRWKRDVMHAGENMGVMFQFGVAWLLAALALLIGLQSALGLVSCASCETFVRNIPFIPDFAPHNEDPSTYLSIIVVLIVSIAISWLTSVYHIRAGKVSGYATLITIGKETRSDMFVEISILAGFLGEYLFHISWLEYAFGIIVAFLILRTAWELFWEANNTFLQVSIGGEFIAGIRSVILSTYGIGSIVKLEAYPVLQAARVKVWVETGGGADANEDLREVLVGRIHEFARKNGFDECRPDVFFSKLDDDAHRDAYAIVKNGEHSFVARDFAHATHLRVYGIANDDVRSALDVPMPKNKDELVALLQRKHVRTHRAWSEEADTVKAIEEAGIYYHETATVLLPER